MNKWNEFVEILRVADLKEFNNVKVVLLSQAIIETGYGTSKLFNDVKNPFGMKYRDFLAKYATKYKYYTDSEPLRDEDDGSGTQAQYDYFCGFDVYLLALQCYCFKISQQSIYENCKFYLDKPKEYLETLCKYWAIDRKYFDKVYDKFEEANKLLSSADNTLENRIIALEKKVKALEDKVMPKKQYKIMLNAGHAGTSGASGKDISIKESVENQVTVAELKALLEKHDEFEVTIVNQNDHNIGLEGVGKATKDYDLAVAIHYNASDNVEHGSEVLVPNSDNEDIKIFANMLVNQICNDNGLQNRGVKERSLSVFTGYNSIENNNCIFVLSEGHFIDDETSASECRKKSLLNARSHYIAIKKWFLGFL